MHDSDSLHSRLAKEEAILAATHEQVESAERRIEALRGEIQSANRQIEVGQKQIAGLREQAQSIEKRISLLRQYIAMATADEAKFDSSTPSTDNNEPIVAADAAAPDTPIDEDVAAEAAAEDELEDIQFVEPFDPPPVTQAPSRKRLLSFEELDDETLTLELLPRTQTFEEELLLVMAHHRKAVAPKDVGRVFRRLDYTPKLTGSERILRQRIEAARHLFEFTGEGRIALTREGREEAKRLLEQLL